MKIIKKIKLICFFLFTVSNCGKVTSYKIEDCEGEFSCVGEKPLIWSENNDIQLKLGKNLPQYYRDAVQEAASTYNDEIFDNSRKFLMNVEANDSYVENHSALNSDGINGIYYVGGHWPYASVHPGAKAITLTRFGSNKEIVEADILFKGGEYTTVSSINLWVYILALHELGHVLGRNHASENNSIMYPVVSSDHRVEPFSTQDVQSFKLHY